MTQPKKNKFAMAGRVSKFLKTQDGIIEEDEEEYDDETYYEETEGSGDSILDD